METETQEQKTGLLRRAVVAMALVPLLIAALVLGGLWLGLQVSAALDRNPLVFALAFSMVGLIFSLIVAMRVVRVLVRPPEAKGSHQNGWRPGRSTERETSEIPKLRLGRRQVERAPKSLPQIQESRVHDLTLGC